MYQGVYINLDRSVDRRNLMEYHLGVAGLQHKYTRFPAVDGDKITYGPEAVVGTSALGCTISHLSAIRDQLDSGTHLHILEDDVILHRDIGKVFESFTNHGELQEWDVLMTDIYLQPDVYLFRTLLQKYKESADSGQIFFLDISDWGFAGANSYFVNKASKEKFLHMMEHAFVNEYVPYDLRIRSLANKKLLKVYTCFPFFSMLSASFINSTIAGNYDPAVPAAEYRRSFYIEPDLEAINASLCRNSQFEPDLHMQIYLNFVKSLVNPEHIPF